VTYQYDKLRGKIVEKFSTLDNFAKALNMSRPTLSLKINNRSEWSQTEIKKACKLLGIKDREVAEYFFKT
jgi:hypothetical protein